ncbi:MAG TPA: hypothetical protein VNW90_20125, partial [Acetobacteraceae bacterium]|nr:hypothetical protein [Acetobacteraceae bacterium]
GSHRMGIRVLFYEPYIRISISRIHGILDNCRSGCLHSTRAASVVLVAFKLTIGLLLVGAGLDGLVSSIHWTILFALPLHALRLL